jgi:hypothetical protein
MSDCQNCDTCPFIEPQKELIYEIHVTVDHKESFVEDCYSIGVKPVVIELGTGIPSHSMTSSTVKGGNDTTVFVTARSISKALEDIGYTVKRVKIETVPWHPKASCPEPGQYFETHFAVKNLNYTSSKNLRHLSYHLGLHYSSNLLKKSDDSAQMLTLRKKNVDYETYRDIAVSMEQALLTYNFKLDKVITEFALYDTNEKMDDQWLNS